MFITGFSAILTLVYRVAVGLSMAVLVGIGLWWMMSGTYQVPTVRELTPHVDEAAYTDIPRTATPSRTTWVFVPYWADMSQGFISGDGDHLMYFGLLIDERGAVYEDDGYLAMSTFSTSAQLSSASRWLTVRMVDSAMSIAILGDATQWPQMHTDIVTVAQEHGFDGVVLDLEVGFPFLVDVRDSITDFSYGLSQVLSAHDMMFAQTVYGDTFYRRRPYDISALADNADYILVMAYDYHKSYGNPGPNFPFERGGAYAYDFKTMVADYKEHVADESIVYVFGMFGYDWMVTQDGKARTAGEALSLNQIRSRFIDACVFASCVWERDPLTHEIMVRYRDAEGNNHIVWGEDEESVRHKRDFLTTQGIWSTGYWAWGYY